MKNRKEKNNMLNPCVEYCYKQLGKEYTTDCDERCEFAKVLKEKKELEDQLGSLIKNMDQLICTLENCELN
jgi:hypothetical protein